MEVDDDDDYIPKKARKRIDSESEDKVVAEFEVVVCDGVPNTDMYCVQFPKSRDKIFNSEVNPRVRYKKNVRLMEMRFTPNIHSGSFDRNKVEKYKSESPMKSPVKTEPGLANDEVYEGRAFKQDNPLQNTIGVIRNGTLYITSTTGIFEMHRIIKGTIGSYKKTDEDEDTTLDSDSDVPSSSRQLRVKFTRPETERQKKRREASALHRERMIASDHWIPMNMHLKNESECFSKKKQLIPKDHSGPTEAAELSAKDLALSAIICGRIEQLDLTRENQLMPCLRIRDLPLHLQVRAQVIKARVISTDDVSRLVEGIDRSSLIAALRDCAHLVQGNWVLHSENLFHGLPPAHCNVLGKVDENRTHLWRNARDFALCLISAGHPVTRLTLSRCFKLNATDAEEILLTIGVKQDRTWTLRLPADEAFINNPQNVTLVLEERRFWVSRWEELKQLVKSA